METVIISIITVVSVSGSVIIIAEAAYTGGPTTVMVGTSFHVIIPRKGHHSWSNGAFPKLPTRNRDLDSKAATGEIANAGYGGDGEGEGEGEGGEGEGVIWGEKGEEGFLIFMGRRKRRW